MHNKGHHPEDFQLLPIIEMDGTIGLGKAVKSIFKKKENENKLSFTKFFKEYVDQQKIDKRLGTHKKVESVLKKFNEF